MERRAYYSGKAQTDHVPVTPLCPGTRDHCQLVQKDTRSGRAVPAASLKGSTVDGVSGKPTLAHAGTEIQRGCAGTCADHTSKIGTQGLWIPMWKAAWLVTPGRTPGRTSVAATGLLLVLFSMWTAPKHDVCLIGYISLPWNIHCMVGGNRHVLNCSSERRPSSQGHGWGTGGGRDLPCLGRSGKASLRGHLLGRGGPLVTERRTDRGLKATAQRADSTEFKAPEHSGREGVSRGCGSQWSVRKSQRVFKQICHIFGVQCYWQHCKDWIGREIEMLVRKLLQLLILKMMTTSKFKQ